MEDRVLPISSIPEPDAALYGGMIARLRDLLDAVAGASPDAAALAMLTTSLTQLTHRFEAFTVDEASQPFGRRGDVPGYGQSLTPLYVRGDGDSRSEHGQARFGRYFLGEGGAVHGGAIPLLLEEVLGRLARSGDRSPSRTAYLRVDFRAPAPIETPLDITARFVSEAGRKRLLRAELRHGETLCAEAEGLFLAPRPEAP